MAKSHSQVLPVALIASGIGIFALSVWARSGKAQQASSAEADLAEVLQWLQQAQDASLQGDCQAANAALLQALQGLDNLGGHALSQAQQQLRSVLLQRYSDPDGLCL